jgi:hypothetical protein
VKQSITGVGLAQNLGLRLWLHDAAIKEGKRFTVKQKALLQHFVRDTGKSAKAIAAKPLGVGAASQPLILSGERSGLLTHAATTVNASWCERMKR